jgi:hypothetical protein
MVSFTQSRNRERDYKSTTGLLPWLHEHGFTIMGKGFPIRRSSFHGGKPSEEVKQPKQVIKAGLSISTLLVNKTNYSGIETG